MSPSRESRTVHHEPTTGVYDSFMTDPARSAEFERRLGAHLAAVRELAGFSQEALAVQLRRDQSYVSRIESAVRHPGLRLIVSGYLYTSDKEHTPPRNLRVVPQLVAVNADNKETTTCSEESTWICWNASQH